MTRYRNVIALLVICALTIVLLFSYAARQFDQLPTVRQYISEVSG